MKPMPVVSMRLAFAVVLVAVLALAAGCGGDSKRMVGSWTLDFGKAGEMLEDMPTITITFNSDGTGSQKTTQTFSQDLPGSMTQRFNWDIEDDKLVLEYLDTGLTHKMSYEFTEDGNLDLKMGRMPAMTYRRVE